MPFLLRPIDLDTVIEDDDMIRGWVADSVQKGRTILGYSGNAYTHCKYGDAEIYSCIVKSKDGEANKLVQFDIQVSGTCIWKVRVSGIKLKNVTPYNMTRLTAVNSIGEGGFTIMHLLNADVLPSYLEDEEITAQVVAFALNVNYYKDEDAFADTVPECEGMKSEELNGKKLLPAMGTVFPNGFLHDHMVREDGTTLEEDEDDDLVVLTGNIKGIHIDSVKMGENVVSKFLRIKVGTQFGDLELIHSRSMISDEEFEILKSADSEKEIQDIVVQAVVVLSGDVAVFEYENGMVKDRKNDLAALRYSLIKGNAERLGMILAEDVVYESVNAKGKIEGKEAVIDHLNYVHENTKSNYIAHMATLEGACSGERCIILAENQDENITAIVRINVSDEGLITKINVFNAASFDYSIDEKPSFDNEL